MAQQTRIGLKDIADATQLSLSTVSRVLANKTPERFPDETRRRVFDVAEKLNYRPNLLAVASRGGSSRTIGVYLPPYDSFWTEVIYGVHDELIDGDHVPLILWPTHIRPEHHRRNADEADVPRERISELSQLHRMIDRAVDGLILWPVVEDEAKQYLSKLASRGLPVIGIDHEPVSDGPRCMVGTDESVCARLVAEHLLSLGHRSFVHLAGPKDLYWASRRADCFEDEIGKCSEAWCMTLTERGPEVTQRALRSLLHPEPKVTAIYAATDEIARIVMSTLNDLGMTIGQDIALVSVGDTGYAQGAGITSVKQRPYQIGALAAELALAASRGELKDTTDRVHMLPPELIVRQSTKSRMQEDHS
ncbi:MAG: LacI family DNA-binding transcriptional regulator [Planctomycetota bacterium]